MISAQTPSVCREGNPASTFPDHALASTRHVKNGAGYVRRLVRDQPDDSVGDFIRGADALHRYHMRELVCAVRLAARGVDFSIDEAGPDCRDANALTGDLVSEPNGE